MAARAAAAHGAVILATALMAQAAKEAPIKASWNTQDAGIDQSLLLQATGGCDSKWFKFDHVSSWCKSKCANVHIFSPVLAYSN